MEESSYHWTDNFGEEPYEEMKQMKRLKEHFDKLVFIADAQYGIPTICPCGEKIKQDVSTQPKFQNDFHTLPGSRYFTCNKFKDDGLHFRQPWVFGVEEEISKLILKVEKQSKRIEEQSKKIEEMQMEIQSQA